MSAKLQVMHLKTNLLLLNFAYIQLTAQVSFFFFTTGQLSPRIYRGQETSWWRSIWAVHRDALLARFLHCTVWARLGNLPQQHLSSYIFPFLGVCSMSRIPFIEHLHIMCMYRKEGLGAYSLLPWRLHSHFCEFLNEDLLAECQNIEDAVSASLLR